MDTKVCQDCLLLLPLSEYYSNGVGRLKTRCKSCYSLRYKDSKKQRDPEAFKAYNREYCNSRYKDEEFRRKKLARSYVISNVRHGYIDRPTECQQCRSTSSIEAHHEDYSKPLEVVWLCKSCHMNRHKELKEARNVY
jgi:hypothetical protein